MIPNIAPATAPEKNALGIQRVIKTTAPVNESTMILFAKVAEPCGQSI